MIQFRYKQTALLVATLVLPSIVIGFLAWRDIVREAAERARDSESRTKAEVRQELLSRLERIKLQRISGADSDPAVVLVASSDRDQLLLPWDATGIQTRFWAPDQDTDFERKILEAGRAEHTDKDSIAAARLYRESIRLAEAARNPHRSEYARLLLAGTQERAGAQAEAVSIHRNLLKLPSLITDRHGIPIAYYAAHRLVRHHSSAKDVRDRLSEDLKSAELLPPRAVHILAGILEVLRATGDMQIAHDAEAALAGIAPRMKYLDQASDLQARFSTLRVTEADWQPHFPENGEGWLVGMAPAKAGSKPVVVAVRADDIFAKIESEYRQRIDSPPFDISINSTSGQPLGENVPGVRLTFLTTGPVVHVGLIPQRPFYVLSLLLVVGLTFLGGYLLRRDVRREVRVAEMRSQFVSSVSHELKTPLTSIRMFAEILQMEDSADPRARAEYLDTIVSETERLTRLLNNVLDFSRIERGQKNYHLQTASLSDIVRRAARTLRFPMSEQGFNFQCDISDDIPSMRADHDAIEQAVLNLLSNAMKYSGSSKDIELRLFAENGEAVIQVSDHGIGIPQEEQKRIFEKFYRVPALENKAISGTGLGLALAAHIIEAHGGHIDVRSAPGEGSTFSIRLPIEARS